jgi:HSP20 family molecular chaperone IbpA
MSVLPFAGPSLASDLLNDEFFSSPFMFDSGLLEIKKEMDRQRELMFKSMSSPTLSLDKMFEPAYNVKEDEDKITFTVSVPDIPLEDIDIEIRDGRVMHISGRKKIERNGAVSVTSFDKRFALGTNMDQDHIAAKLHGGELIVETPKLVEIEGDKKVKKITIKEEL